MNIVKMAIPKTLCAEVEKTIMKYIWKHKKPRIAKAILSKKSNAGGITIPDFKLYNRAVTNKNSMVLAQNRQEDQWIIIEDP
jgi:hypothetical protein